MNKIKLVEQNPVIQVFKKNIKKVFCEIEVPDESHFEELSRTLNSAVRYIVIGGHLIIDKSEIDHIIFKTN